MEIETGLGSGGDQPSDATGRPPLQSRSQERVLPSDPVQTLLLVLVVVLILAVVGYLCVAHPSLTAPIAAVAGVGAGLAAVFTVVVSLRRR